MNSIPSRVAQNLTEPGVYAGTKVPMFFKKSVWAVVSVMGIIKAGTVFDPFDPTRSKTRIESMVDQVGCQIFLCSAEYAETCSSMFTRIVPALEQNLKSLAGFFLTLNADGI